MIRIVFYGLIILLLTACNGQSEKEIISNSTDTVNEIRTLEKQLFNKAGKLNPSIVNQLNALYSDYAAANPSDFLTPFFIFNQAEIQMGIGNFERSINLFDKVYKNYPDFEKRIDALFMKGFVYDEHLKMKGAAQDAYNQLIKNHAESEFAVMAKEILEVLHLSEEELLKRLERNKI